jgi:CubicO group peptidase (beta-lactamase class C family)
VIGKILPDYPNKDAAEKVTIRHLLTHTSGIGDYFNERFMKSSRDQFRDIKDFLPLFAEEPLQFEPGSRFRYSNGGFIVLGAIIEKLAGQDYFQYVREHIYQPAGMQNTDCYEVDSDTPNLAVGYTHQGAQQDGQWKNNLLLHVVRGGSAGGGYSTVEDLLHFAEALESGKLVKAETLEQWTTPSDKNPHYAYGFEIDNESGQRAYGHRGGFPGVSSMLLVDRESRITTVVLSNIDKGAMPVAEKLRELSSKW